MKRLPQVVSFILFIVLCASAAYWAMQLFKPPVRPVAAPPRVAKAEIKPESAAALFGGGRTKVAVASNYQLHGVVVSGTGSESVAILSADGKPAQAVRMEKEVMPGVTVKEVHRDYVLLSEGGVTKRVELPESAKGQDNIATVSPVRTAPGQPASTRPPPMVSPPAATTGAPPQMGQGRMPPGPPGAVASPGSVPPPPGNSAVNPPPSPEPPPPVVAVPGAPPAPGVSTGSSGTSGTTGAPGVQPGVPGAPAAQPGVPGVPGPTGR
jgi:general secretion pathway protein C